MNAQNAIRLARLHAGPTPWGSSARVCLTDAVELYDAGDYDAAKARARKSLAYSVGESHPDYRRSA